MARMRSLKPEYWDDEELATATSRDARLLYPGLWNFADEHGRLRGDPRFLKGKIFAYDDDLTPDRVDALVDELARAGKVIRYRVGGASFLYLPRLDRHQRLEPDKVPSRLPGPDQADPEPPPRPPAQIRPDESARGANESAQKRTVDEDLWNGAADLPEYATQIGANSSARGANSSALKHVAGSREHVAGIPPTAGTALALVPRADEAEPPDTTQALVGEWIDHCRKRPPGTVIGQVGKQVKAMLAEAIDPADIRVGLAAWWRKGLHPSALPSVVNEHMNASPAAPPPRPSTTDQKVAAGLALAARLEAAQELLA